MSKIFNTGLRTHVLTATLGLSLLAGCRTAGDDARAVAPANESLPAARAATSNAAVLEWNTILYEVTKADDGHKHSLAAARRRLPCGSQPGARGPASLSKRACAGQC